MRNVLLALAFVLPLGACDAPPGTIAGKIQVGVEKACQFRANATWLNDIVVKADITIQMVDAMITKICASVVAARSSDVQGLVSPKCPYGEIEVGGQVVCIEGEPVEGEAVPVPEKKEGE